MAFVNRGNYLFMEEKIDIKETLDKLKKEQVEKFINEKTSHSGFSDEQKGVISAWLEEAVNLGYEIGEEHGMGEANPEALGRIIDVFSSAMGVGEKGDNEESLKNLFYSQRYVIRWLLMTLSSYDSAVDELTKKHPLLQSKVLECLGLSKS